MKLKNIACEWRRSSVIVVGFPSPQSRLVVLIRVFFKGVSNPIFFVKKHESLNFENAYILDNTNGHSYIKFRSPSFVSGVYRGVQSNKKNQTVAASTWLNSYWNMTFPTFITSSIRRYKTTLGPDFELRGSRFYRPKVVGKNKYI